MQMHIPLQVKSLNNLFLFDIDGTLSMDGVIPNSALKTISLLRKHQDLVFLCTGRCFGQMKELLSKVEVDGVIANNGAYACYGKKIFFEQPIPLRCIEKLLQTGYPIGVLSADCYGILNDDYQIMDRFCSYFQIEYPQVLKKDYIQHHLIYSMGMYTDEDITNTINEFSELHFMKVCPVGYDIVLKGVSKASPIRKLREMFANYKLYGFGDNINDIEMLQEVDVAVVMGQAPASVKKYADVVTKSPLEDGIWYATHELLKIV